MTFLFHQAGMLNLSSFYALKLVFIIGVFYWPNILVPLVVAYTTPHTIC